MSDPLDPIDSPALDERQADDNVEGFDPDIDPIRHGDEDADGD